MQVSLPSALIHGSASNDPRVKELQEELNIVNRKILDNELDIPPEGQRSPSPEPQYDRNGIRLNTREVRMALEQRIAIKKTNGGAALTAYEWPGTEKLRSGFTVSQAQRWPPLTWARHRQQRMPRNTFAQAQS